MRRRVFLLVTVLIGLDVVPAVPAAAAPAAPGGWTEGFHLAIDPTINCGIQGGGFKVAAIDATKTFDGRGRVRSSRFEVFHETGGHVPTFTSTSSIGRQVFDVPVDPDSLPRGPAGPVPGARVSVQLPASGSSLRGASCRRRRTSPLEPGEPEWSDAAT
jgi:hypothetical protein